VFIKVALSWKFFFPFKKVWVIRCVQLEVALHRPIGFWQGRF